MKIAKEGLLFILIPLLFAAIFYALDVKLLAALSLLVSFFMTFFFRVPKRSIPDDPKAILAPADGKIVDISKGRDYVTIAIFLSPLDVHVNRIPHEGEVVDVKYIKGKHLQAFRPAASKQNERVITTISTRYGTYRVAQIAGILARRVVCYLKPGDKVERGQVFGMIKFGSRTELTMSTEDVHIVVKIGEKVKGGETIVAYFKGL